MLVSSFKETTATALSQPNPLGGIILKSPRFLDVLVERLPALVTGVLLDAPFGFARANRLRDKARA